MHEFQLHLKAKIDQITHGLDYQQKQQYLRDLAEKLGISRDYLKRVMGAADILPDLSIRLAARVGRVVGMDLRDGGELEQFLLKLDKGLRKTNSKRYIEDNIRDYCRMRFAIVFDEPGLFAEAGGNFFELNTESLRKEDMERLGRTIAPEKYKAFLRASLKADFEAIMDEAVATQVPSAEMTAELSLATGLTKEELMQRCGKSYGKLRSKRRIIPVHSPRWKKFAEEVKITELGLEDKLIETLYKLAKKRFDGKTFDQVEEEPEKETNAKEALIALAKDRSGVGKKFFSLNHLSKHASEVLVRKFPAASPLMNNYLGQVLFNTKYVVEDRVFWAHAVVMDLPEEDREKLREKAFAEKGYKGGYEAIIKGFKPKGLLEEMYKASGLSKGNIVDGLPVENKSREVRFRTLNKILAGKNPPEPKLLEAMCIQLFACEPPKKAKILMTKLFRKYGLEASVEQLEEMTAKAEFVPEIEIKAVAPTKKTLAERAAKNKKDDLPTR